MTSNSPVLWEYGDIQLTADAVLIGMGTEIPDVVPLNTIEDVSVEQDCVVLKVKEGPAYYCMLSDPNDLASHIKEQIPSEGRNEEKAGKEKPGDEFAPRRGGQQAGDGKALPPDQNQPRRR